MTPAPEEPTTGAPQPGSGYPPGPTFVQALPEQPEATKAMILGLVSLVGGLTCWLPLLLGPYAWVVGRRSVRQIDAEPGRWGGRPQASAGYVLGVVSTVLLGLALLVVVGFVVFFVLTFLALDSQTGKPFTEL